MQVRVASNEDWHWIEQNAGSVGGPKVVSRGTLYTLSDHEGFVATAEDSLLGFAVLRQDELLAIATVHPGQGVGSTLMEHCEKLARSRGNPSIWLVTTNDNLDAMRFYQRRGYFLESLTKDAFEVVKRIKGITGEVLGNFDIPIRDELVFRKPLEP